MAQFTPTAQRGNMSLKQKLEEAAQIIAASGANYFNYGERAAGLAPELKNKLHRDVLPYLHHKYLRAALERLGYERVTDATHKDGSTKSTSPAYVKSSYLREWEKNPLATKGRGPRNRRRTYTLQDARGKTYKLDSRTGMVFTRKTVTETDEDGSQQRYYDVPLGQWSPELVEQHGLTIPKKDNSWKGIPGIITAGKWAVLGISAGSFVAHAAAVGMFGTAIQAKATALLGQGVPASQVGSTALTGPGAGGAGAGAGAGAGGAGAGAGALTGVGSPRGSDLLAGLTTEQSVQLTQAGITPQIYEQAKNLLGKLATPGNLLKAGKMLLAGVAGNEILQNLRGGEVGDRQGLADANRRAAEREVEAAEKNILAWQEERELARTETAPWREEGKRALDILGDKLASGYFAGTDLEAPQWEGYNVERPTWEGFTAEDMEADPGYLYRQAEAEKMIRRNANRLGIGQSGATLDALLERGQEMASQEFARARARAVEDYGLESKDWQRGYDMARQDYEYEVGEYGRELDRRHREFGQFRDIADRGQRASERFLDASGRARVGETVSRTQGAQAYGAGEIGYENALLTGQQQQMMNSYMKNQQLFQAIGFANEVFDWFDND